MAAQTVLMGGIFRAMIAAVALGAASAAAAADVPPICADRPGKANPTCTVPTGVVQIETGLIDWTHDDSDGVSSDGLVLGATALKYGLTNRWHVELDVTPYQSVRVSAGGAHRSDSSFGDLVVRTKYRLTSGDGVQVALFPFVKIPTANSRLGNRKIEAGVAVPIDYAIPNSPFSVALGPEIDWLADDDGLGHHAAMVQVIGVGMQVAPRLTVGADLWGQWNWDPAGTNKQATADGSVAYLVSNSVQIDG
ncbi:MAG TPA: transporter, partial [Casimicrobiaceae bacterium]